MKNSGNFTDLILWQKSRSFRNRIYEICQAFPKEEKFRLADQMIRSTRSICSNIAEGHGRFHYQENIQYCQMARGSLIETLDHLICALDCKFISESEFADLKMLVFEIKKILNGYILHLKKQKNQK